MHVTEIFESIQGETTHAGRPCAFVRFTGCDLRCRYCDTTYAFHGGTAMSADAILERLRSFGTRYVTLTGGEPLLQRELPQLCARLLEEGWEVAVETHGQLPAESLPEPVARILDVKTPSSGEPDRRFVNLGSLRPRDEVKFVIGSREDFDWSREVIARFELERQVPVLLSPAFGLVEPRDLVAWMLEARLRARLNLQIHKYVWDPLARGV